MAYPSDLTDEQWALLKPVFNAPGKRGRKHADDLRTVVDAILYIAQTGCQWRYLPESFGPWTRVWSQFRRWSRNGTWARALTVLHAAAREDEGRAEVTPSMRVVAVDVTGLPVAGVVVPASMHENETTRVVLDHLAQQGMTGRLDLVLVDRGVSARAADGLGRRHGVEVRRVGWDDKQPVFRPIRHAWRVEVATAGSAVVAGSRSRSRTRRPQRPAGSRSPASPPPCGT